MCNFILTMLILVTLSLTVSRALGKATFKNVNFGRVIGGKAASPNEFPYHLALELNGVKGSCGATIINENWALTAAHCTYALDPQYIQITAADHSLSKSDGTEQIRDIEGKFEHEEYDSVTQENDIALLKLKKPFKFSQRVGPIQLPDSKFVASGKGQVIGWGVTELKKDGPIIRADILQKMNLPIADHAACKIKYDNLPATDIPMRATVTDKMICAGFLVFGGKDACQGDSGGSLAVEGNHGEKIIAGITSFGANCALIGYPGVYTEVAKYRDWIDSHIKPITTYRTGRYG